MPSLNNRSIRRTPSDKAWTVNFVWGNRIYRKSFKDSEWGNRRESLKWARLFRTLLCGSLNRPLNKQYLRCPGDNAQWKEYVDINPGKSVVPRRHSKARSA